MASCRKPPRNFSAYGTMEAVNAILVPAMAFWLGWPRTPSESLALIVAALATSGLLIVGAIYWLAVGRRLCNNRMLFQHWLVFADRAERPIRILLAAAVAAWLAALLLEGWSVSVIASLILTVLAALEYVNYYHWQLQNFDTWADFRRLLSLRGLKRAHSARELSAYRASCR